MTTANGYLDGIFSGLSAPTPELTRLWLQVTRTALAWSQEKAAHAAKVELADLRRLEETGEPLNEEDDDALDALATEYLQAAWTHPAALPIVDRLRIFGQAFTHDANFPMARFLRGRRAELGLTLEQVSKRTGGAISAEDLGAGEWDGTRHLYDYGYPHRALAEALEVPYLELYRLVERGAFDADDIDEWVAWRDGQRKPAPRKRTRRG